MKKIFIITLLLISVSVSANNIFDTNQGLTNMGNTNQGVTNTGNTNQGNTNMGNTNYNSILGGGDGALNTGLGNQNSNTGSELNRTSPFSSSNGVPKLSFSGLIAWIISIMNQLIYLILVVSLVSFLYGILKLSFIDGGKPEAREQARKFMFWGIVSLFVMVSVWGLVQIFNVTLFGGGSLVGPQFK